MNLFSLLIIGIQFVSTWHVQGLNSYKGKTTCNGWLPQFGITNFSFGISTALEWWLTITHFNPSFMFFCELWFTYVGLEWRKLVQHHPHSLSLMMCLQQLRTGCRDDSWFPNNINLETIIVSWELNIYNSQLTVTVSKLVTCIYIYVCIYSQRQYYSYTHQF